MKKTLLLLLIVLLLIPLSPNAKVNLSISSKKEVFSMLQNAFQVQVSLSEQTRTEKEINDLLDPYFSESYQKLFWDENVFEEEGKFVTYGSDFALYFIPFFQYSDETKINISKDSIYVFEFFPANSDGPVGWEDHYEGILLKKENGGWKIDEYLYNNIPDFILEQAKSTYK